MIGGVKKFAIEDFAWTGNDIVELSQQTYRYILRDIASEPNLFIPRRTSKEREELYTSTLKTDWTEMRKSVGIAIAGPVYRIFDETYFPEERNSPPFISVSASALNFQAKGAAARSQFIGNDSPSNTDIPEGMRGQVTEEMKRILRLVFGAMKHQGVTIPCFPAFGCGAFATGVASIPTLWAQAFLTIMKEYSRDFSCFIFALPGDNYTTFHNVFKNDRELQRPVVLLRPYSIITLAHHLSRNLAESRLASGKPHRVGVLNPSDPVATRLGCIGTGWLKGHVALEELFAVFTTLLTQHVDIDPTLFTDDKRRVVL